MSYRTEEEQIAVFKQWWSENGQALVIGIVLALAGFFAWTTWQKNTLHNNQRASDEFQSLLVLLEAGDSVDESAVQAKVESLQQDYSATFYAEAASLLLAQQAAEKSDWAKAVSILEELVESKPSDEVLALARLRLGKIYYSMNELDKGIALLYEPIPEAFKPAYYDLKGDMYVLQQDYEKAEQSYNEVRRVLVESGQSDIGDIQKKIDALPLAENTDASQVE